MLTLKGFQVDTVNEAVNHVAEVLDGRRNALVVVVAAPTASGKTVMLSAVLRKTAAESNACGKPIVWFWLAPFKGLIGQAEGTLRTEAGLLRLRDLSEDRRAEITLDGDVWVSTWQSVSSKDDAARRIRDGNEDNPSIFALVDLLRESPKRYAVGFVIDEAHHSIRPGSEAFEFLKRIHPDVVLMASATPDFDRADAVANLLECERLTLTVSRKDVVSEGLNKPNALAAVVAPEDAREIGAQVYEVAIHHAVQRNRMIRNVLEGMNVDIEPLLLVQVENGKDAVAEAVALLEAAGMAPDEIATHTADEPDPDLLRLASDPSKKALVFKTAIATGFDAPRAWVMAALRRVRDKDFGIQILGRLMRVHPLLQDVGNLPLVLDTAYLVLTYRESQGGLEEAAAALNSTRTDMQVVRPYSARSVQNDKGIGGFLKSSGRGPVSPISVSMPEEYTYGIRSDLDGMPLDLRLLTERPRNENVLNPKDVARNLQGLDRVKLIGWIGDDEATVRVEESVLLGQGLETEAGKEIRTKRDVSAMRQLAERTLRGIANRAPLLTAIKDRLGEILGPRTPEDSVRLATYALLAYEPGTFRDALARAGAEVLEVVPADEPLPAAIRSLTQHKPAKKNIYGIMPPGMMGEWEIEFARWLDATDDVLWWHRNEPRQPWSVAVRKEDGRPFYPDFVVRVRGRKQPGIRLIDPHERLHDADGKMKARTRHIEYGRTMMVFRSSDDKRFHIVRVGADQQPESGPVVEATMLAAED